jgi:predicted SAM-dependent methyltransferase
MSSWPFPDRCFDGIFTEYVLEHFSREKGFLFLKECCRILQPNDLIRIVVPDGQKIMRAYFDNPDELVRHRDKGFACSMDRVNSYFRQSYEHQFIYNEEMLCIQMTRVEFIEPHSPASKCGENSDLLLDATDYEWESLYLEARKPA